MFMGCHHDEVIPTKSLPGSSHERRTAPKRMPSLRLNWAVSPPVQAAFIYTYMYIPSTKDLSHCDHFSLYDQCLALHMAHLVLYCICIVLYRSMVSSCLKPHSHRAAPSLVTCLVRPPLVSYWPIVAPNYERLVQTRP